MIGYIRVSTQEQASTGYGLQAQEQQIRDACKQKGWELEQVFRDEGQSARSLDRPELRKALEAVAGGAGGLIVAKLDRLSRSVVDFGNLIAWFEQADARLIALDLDIDTGTASGRLVANVFAAVAAWELETIQERTRAGLRAARAQGRAISRPSVQDRPEVAQRIRELRASGCSYVEICDVLNAERVPTVRGGLVWRPSAIQSLFVGRRAKRRGVVQLPKIGAR